MPKTTPTIVDVPEMKFIAVNGCEILMNRTGEYQQAFGYSLSCAYALKMSYKTDLPYQWFL